MTAPLDEGVERLRALCELLRDTNPVIESGAADLDRLAHILGESESHLATDLEHLATDVDALQKQAEAGEADAVKACEELGHAAEEVKAPGLANLEGHAATTQGHWEPALKEKTAALESAFEELKTAGWETLQPVLDSQQAEFQHWTQGAETAVAGIVQLLTTTSTEVDHDVSQAGGAAKEMVDAAPFEHAFWQDSESHANRVKDETVPWFRKAELELVQTLDKAHKELCSAADQGSDHVRAQLDLTTAQVGTAIDGKSDAVAQAAEKTLGALGGSERALEVALVQAEQAEVEAQAMAELAGHVTEAKVKLFTIHEVMESLER